LNKPDSNAQPAEPKKERPRVAFGVERLALIPFKAPTVTVLVAIMLAAMAVVGIQRIRVDDSLSQLFRSDDPAFERFEQVSRDFPSSEYDILIVVSGDSLLARESVGKLRNFVTDVQLVDGTRGALSMFSARLPAPHGGAPAPLFSEPLPQGDAYHQLMDQVKANETIRGKLLSEDGKLAVIILSLEPSVVDGGKLDTVVQDVRRTANEDLGGAGLTVELTGVPVMQLEIRNALKRDRILYNSVGFALGCAIAGLFFRRLSLMIVAAAPPLIAIVLALGVLGWQRRPCSSLRSSTMRAPASSGASASRIASRASRYAAKDEAEFLRRRTRWNLPLDQNSSKRPNVSKRLGEAQPVIDRRVNVSRGHGVANAE
jgi:predicted RND superfamily exporter protein